MIMNSWAGTWQINFVSSGGNKGKILLDDSLPGQLILDIDPFAQQMNVESYICTDVVNMPAYWKNCLFIKHGSVPLAPPNRAGSPEIPYAAYNSGPRNIVEDTYNKVADDGRSGISTSTERLIAASPNNDPSAHVEYIFLYRIQNSVTPDVNASGQNKDFLIANIHFWNTYIDGGSSGSSGGRGGGGSSDGTGSGSKTRP